MTAEGSHTFIGLLIFVMSAKPGGITSPKIAEAVMKVSSAYRDQGITAMMRSVTKTLSDEEKFFRKGKSIGKGNNNLPIHLYHMTSAAISAAHRYPIRLPQVAGPSGITTRAARPSARRESDNAIEEEGSLQGSEVEGDSLENEVNMINSKDWTATRLNEWKRKELVEQCEIRGLRTKGPKRDLIELLLGCKDEDDNDSINSDDTTGATSTRQMETPVLTAKARNLDNKKGKEKEPVEGIVLNLQDLNLKDKEICFDQLTHLEKLDSGSYKVVSKGIYEKKLVAIATFIEPLTQMGAQEIMLQSKLEHENLVKMIGVSLQLEPQVQFHLVLELCSKGNLYNYIRKVPEPPLLVILDIMMGFSKGLEFLHTRKPPILHRDVKSPNILITEGGKAKLGDFGFAKVTSGNASMLNSVVGTPRWQAPEILHPNPRYGDKVDVFSAGVVFWELLQWYKPEKAMPFEGMDTEWIEKYVGQEEVRQCPVEMYGKWGTEIVVLMSRMQAANPADRPSMTEVVRELEVLIVTEKKKEKFAPPAATARKRKRVNSLH